MNAGSSSGCGTIIDGVMQPCDSADFNRDGEVNGDDITAFIAAKAGTYYVPAGDIGEYRFLYRGYWYDRHLHIYHVRHRAYDPEIQRWLQPDPAYFVDGLNRYAYCGNEPVHMYDPMGLWAWDDDWVETIIDVATQRGVAKNFVQGAADGGVMALNQFTFEASDTLNQISYDIKMQAEAEGLADLYIASEAFSRLSREAALAAATGGAANAATAGLAKAATSNTGRAFVLSTSLKLGELRLAPATLETIHVLATSSRSGYVVSSIVVGAKAVSKNSNAYVGKTIVYEITTKGLSSAFRYGESAQTKLVNGIPNRIQTQLRELKKLYPGREFGHRIIKVFDNKLDAKALERGLIEDFYDLHGCMPEGNKVFR